jgi:glutamate carboxypeptidase
MKQLLAFCESRRPAMLAALEALARLESPSTDKAAVDACGREAASRLADAGGRVTILPREGAGDCVLATFGDRGSRILLLGHLDTVWPVGQLKAMPLRVEDGRLHGPGVFDMKAGVVIALEAVRALTATALARMPNVTVLLTGDEETGSAASRAILENEARRSDVVLVLEPALPGGALKTARKGCGEFELRVRGVAAHAGIEPEKGASAVLELAEQLLAVERLQDPARGTTLNAGVVGGGTRANVVPGEARAIIDARVWTRDEAERIERDLRGLRPRRAGTSLDCLGGFDRPPFERTEAVGRLFGEARAVAAELGFHLDEGPTGGGSDGNFTAALGVPTLDGLGAEGAGAHAAHEHVLVDRLAPRAALVAGLLARIGGREA